MEPPTGMTEFNKSNEVNDLGQLPTAATAAILVSITLPTPPLPPSALLSPGVLWNSESRTVQRSIPRCAFFFSFFFFSEQFLFKTIDAVVTHTSTTERKFASFPPNTRTYTHTHTRFKKAERERERERERG